MIHKNSLEAYEYTKPGITGNRKKVYEVIREHRAITAKEVAAFLGWEINRVTPRIYELRKAGAVIEAGSSKNELDISVTLYAPTDTTSSIERVFRDIDGGENMVNADEFYGEYLKGEDLKEDVDVTIKSVGPETVGDEEKLVVHFEEQKKSLVLNKTNKDRIKQLTGTAETDTWTGAKITLTTEPVAFKGETKPAIRVKQVGEDAKKDPKSTSEELLEKVAAQA